MKPLPTLLVAMLISCGPEISAETSETSSTSTSGASETDPIVGSSSTTGDPTDATTDDTTCNFVCESGSIPEDGLCDIWGQDCPDDEKCAAYADDGGFSWNSVKCVPVHENGGVPGDSCMVEGNGVSGIDSCAHGSMCWHVSAGTGQGVCVALCTGTPMEAKCAPEGTSCVIANEGVLNLCLQQCDPLLQDCADSDLCLPNPIDMDDFVCVPS